MLKTVVLLVALVAIVYVVFVRRRGWHVDHYTPAVRRAHFIVCLALGLVVATVASYLLRDEIMCPSGTTYTDVVGITTSSGKGGFAIQCVAAASGDVVRGSMFAGMCAWLAALVGTFAVASAIWRRFGPPAPSRDPQIPTAYVAPSDKRDRRQQAARDRRDRDRRRG